MHCFNCIPQILICCIFIFCLIQNTLFLLEIFFNPQGLCRIVLMNFQSIDYFLIIFLLLLSSLTLYWSQTRMLISILLKLLFFYDTGYGLSCCVSCTEKNGYFVVVGYYHFLNVNLVQGGS